MFLRRFAVLVSTLLSVVAVLFVVDGAAPASAVTCQSVGSLFHSQLNPGQCITSPSGGAYVLVMQGDGNLVLYRTSDSRACWNSRTNGHGGDVAGFYPRRVTTNPAGTTASQPVLWEYTLQVRVPGGGYHFSTTATWTGPQNADLYVNVTSTGNVWFGYTLLGTCQGK